MTGPLVSTTTVEEEGDIREFCDRLSTSFHNRWVDVRDRSGYELGEYDPLELIVEWRFETAEELAADGGEALLPLKNVVTPTLDEWEHREGGWSTWVAPDESFRVHVEMITLEVPAEEAALTAFEVRLDDCRNGRPYPVVVKEILRNSHLAVAVAELLASEPERYADEWEEGLAPRPEDVGALSER